MDIVDRLRAPATVFYEYAADNGAFLREAANEIERLRQVLQKITELSPFKSNTGNASIQYITQMLVEMTALAHEALKEKA